MRRYPVAVLLMAGMLRAQDVPPPPKPPDDGPSLADTLKFIADKVEGQGPVNFLQYFHDNLTGRDDITKYRYETSRISPDPDRCVLRFHTFVSVDGKTIVDTDVSIAPKDMTEIIVEPDGQRQKRASTEVGNPEHSFRSDPQVFVVTTKTRGDRFQAGVMNAFDFRFLDEVLANRVAKALVHAVELCGGGNKEPF